MSQQDLQNYKSHKFLAKIIRFIPNLKTENWFLIYSLLVIFSSFFVFFFNYQNPPYPVWDEPYHIAAAQKYERGVYFQEPHPPLGKLLIALGEKMFNQNPPEKFERFLKKEVEDKIYEKTKIRRSFNENLESDRQMLEEVKKLDDPLISQYIMNLPPDYNFAGPRFFPALLAFLASYLFFLLIYTISKNYHLAFLISLFYIFDNALAVHFRTAMLDGILMFFVLASLLFFTWMYQNDKQKLKHYFILGCLVALAVMTKVNSLVLLLLFPFLMYKVNLSYFTDIKKNWLKIADNLFFKGLIFLLGLVLVVFLIQDIHLLLGKDKIIRENYASAELVDAIKNKKLANPYYVLVSLQDWANYSTSYTQNVSSLDICSASENGSLPITWPIGDRTISYRWSKYTIKKSDWWNIPAKFNPQTKSLDEYSQLPDWEKENYEHVTEYSYLVPNPVVWLVSLLGVLLSFAYLISIFLFQNKFKNRFLFEFTSFFTIMYLAYMIPVLFVQRVLYLYHYLIPLIFGIILFCLIILNWLETKENKAKVYFGLFLLAVGCLLCFAIFAPFTYSLPITQAAFNWRNWFSFWAMRSA